MESVGAAPKNECQKRPQIVSRKTGCRDRWLRSVNRLAVQGRCLSISSAPRFGAEDRRLVNCPDSLRLRSARRPEGSGEDRTNFRFSKSRGMKRQFLMNHYRRGARFGSVSRHDSIRFARAPEPAGVIGSRTGNHLDLFDRNGSNMMTRGPSLPQTNGMRPRVDEAAGPNRTKLGDVAPLDPHRMEPSWRTPDGDRRTHPRPDL